MNPVLHSKDLVICLRDLRRCAGLTQKELAKLTGIGEKTISSFETGQRIHTIKFTQLEKIVVACGLTLREFLTSFVDPGEVKPSPNLLPFHRSRTADEYVQEIRTLLDQAEADRHKPVDVVLHALHTPIQQARHA